MSYFTVQVFRSHEADRGARDKSESEELIEVMAREIAAIALYKSGPKGDAEPSWASPVRVDVMSLHQDDYNQKEKPLQIRCRHSNI